MKSKKISKKSNIKKLILAVVLVLFVSLAIGVTVRLLTVPKIDRVLETKSYSYLPKEAKNYIKKVYEETGEIILTEKNKVSNQPYLNPRYVVYLSLNDEEKKGIYEIPEAYVIDYVYEESSDIENLPSSYDLRAINNNNSYITPMQDQGNLGLCWAFASIEQAESYLMLKNSNPYNEFTQMFSVRQMDYAASTNGIKGYTNENGYRELTSGGNFYMSSELMSNGLTLVDNSYMTYDENTDKKYLNDILNYANSLYEVDSTVIMPNISSDATEEEFNSYIDLIKSYVVEYGGAYVGTESPNYSCGSLNSDGTYIIRVDDSCVQNAGHAMQIIGWDDNYSYSYCKNTSSHSNKTGTCSEENLVEGTGAWLLKNSWGTDAEYQAYQYVYLAYDSLNSSIGFTTSLNEMSSRTWDNNYHENFVSGDNGYADTTDYIEFSKVDNSTEKVEKIKFMSFAIDGTFNVSVSSKNEYYSAIKVEVPLPGIYTIDVSDKDMIITDSSFDVLISSTNDTNLITGSISVFTSNADEIPVIETDDVTIPKVYISGDSDYEFYVYSKTKNIPSNAVVKYSLYNSAGDNLDDYMFIQNDNDSNEVAVSKNDVSVHMIIDREIGAGTYTLKAEYDGYEYFSTVTLGEMLNVEGSGTADSPYLITNESELSMLGDYLSNDSDLSTNTYYYKLTNDIVLTKDWTPVGTASSPFTGSLDGDGHTITGLNVNSDSYGGLFGRVSSATIKNLTIDDFNVVADNNAGALIGYVNATGDVDISNINIMDGKVVASGENGAAGTLIGMSFLERLGSCNINNIFSSATVSGKYSSGLIGIVSNEVGYTLQTNISNVINVGNIDLRENEGSITNSGLVIGYVGNKSLPNMSNVLVTGRIYDTAGSNYNGFVGDVYDDFSIYGSEIKNGYYVNGTLPFKDISESYSDYEVKILKKNITELKDESLYSSWDGFSDNWTIKTIDGITRIPVLNNVDFTYTAISDITISHGEMVNLYDFITPNIDAAKNVSCTIGNEAIISIDDEMNIKGLSVGTTTIHVISDYDGYEKDVNVMVEAKANPEVHYYANNGTDEKKVQITSSSSDFVLDDNTFTKEGYKLKEWNTEVDGSGTGYENMASMSALTNDIDLYAIWEAISYELVYNYNGEFDNIVKEVKYDEETVIIENENEKTGYKFVEWNTKSDGTGTSYEVGATISNLTTNDGEKINLYAIWERTTRTITYDANGGTGTIESVTVEKGTKVTITASQFAKEGYLFNNWNTKSDGTGSSYYAASEMTIQNDITLYAQWMPNLYYVEFQSNGGTGSMSKQSLTYDKETVLSANVFTRTGYNFAGWNTEADGSGTGYSNEASVKNLTTKSLASINLYAQWSPIEYQISFDANGGEGTMASVSTKYDVATTLLASEFSKEGYVFNSWNTKADGTGDKYTNEQVVKNLVAVDETITLYAQWSPNVYSVVFDSNGGEGTMPNQELTYDVEEALSENLFTKEGYEFVSWNTKADGTGTSYNDKEKVKNLSSVENLTLYAQWEDSFTYSIEDYEEDKTNYYIDKIDVLTDLETYKSKFKLGSAYKLEIDLGTKEYVFTGSKTKIYKNDTLVIEFTNIVRGEVNGDGKVNYLDYVNVYNHIYKTKNPDSDKKLLVNEYFVAADMSGDSKVNYLDYVKIYNKILELKGGTN